MIMMKIMRTFTIISIFLFFSACSVTKVEKGFKSADFTPDKVEMQVTFDDYKLLGEMEVTVQYSRYFGLFKIMNTINGEVADRRTKSYISLYGADWADLDRNLRRALYKVHEKYPSGDFVVPTYKIVKKKKMFMGRRVTEILKVKVYRMNS
jgi:hypothetical protein